MFKHRTFFYVLIATAALGLAACSGDDGQDGTMALRARRYRRHQRLQLLGPQPERRRRHSPTEDINKDGKVVTPSIAGLRRAAPPTR